MNRNIAGNVIPKHRIGMCTASDNACMYRASSTSGVVTAVGDASDRYDFALAFPVPCISTPGGQGFHVKTAVLNADGSFPNFAAEVTDDVRFNIVVP